MGARTRFGVQVPLLSSCLSDAHMQTGLAAGWKRLPFRAHVKATDLDLEDRGLDSIASAKKIGKKYMKAWDKEREPGSSLVV